MLNTKNRKSGNFSMPPIEEPTLMCVKPGSSRTSKSAKLNSKKELRKSKRLEAKEASKRAGVASNPLKLTSSKSVPKGLCQLKTSSPSFKYTCDTCGCKTYPSCTYSDGEQCEDCMRWTDNGHRLDRTTGVLRA